MENNRPENLNVSYTSSKDDYSLSPNQVNLKVVLKGQTPDGLQISKI